MKMILEIIYSIILRKTIRIFNPIFVKQNKMKYKIIYKNKIYPLQSQFEFMETKNERAKIKIMCYNDLPNLFYVIKGCESFYEIYVSKKYIKIYDEYKHYIKLLDKSHMIYKLIQKEDKVRIFGEYFVNNNKGKCFIIYNDIIFPLKEYFLNHDIVKENENKLEIYFVEMENIFNKSCMFHSCKLLEEFNLEININKILQEKPVENKKNKEFEESARRK